MTDTAKPYKTDTFGQSDLLQNRNYRCISHPIRIEQ